MRLFAYFLPLFPLVLLAPRAGAESKNPDDYPLRIHFTHISEHTFYHRRMDEGTRGEGSGNLFQDSVAHGVDFEFECDAKLQHTPGWETFRAKWKKPEQELVVLEPGFGKDGSSTCKLRVQMKDFVYVRRNGETETVPVSEFKQWMVKHDFDPEHGKDAPARLGAQENPGDESPAAPVMRRAPPPAASPAPETPPAGQAPPTGTPPQVR